MRLITEMTVAVVVAVVMNYYMIKTLKKSIFLSLLKASVYKFSYIAEYNTLVYLQVRYKL